MSQVIASDADRAQLADLGITPDEVERQIALFARPPAPVRLDRPCMLGDGIRGLSVAERAAARQAHAAAAAAGRVSKFTPASGAASRMFQSLLAVRGAGLRTRAAVQARADAGDGAAADVLRVLDGLPRFAFAEALAAAAARGGRPLDRALAAGDVGAVLDLLLTPVGLDYAAQPKGLLLFHRYPDGARTAFEEHLVETAAVARDATGAARLHLTVSPEHASGFAALLERVRGAYEGRYAARFAVGFSTQHRCTDTIAVDADNRPFRTEDGRLLFRPGGHGALIGNLGSLGGDLVFIKNIDNVQPDAQRGPALEWMQLLLGHAAALQAAIAGHLRALAGGAPAARRAAVDFVGEAFGVALPADAPADALRAALDRPLRVCGVVRNTGEPGGGPFWVRGADGRVSAQIVESAEVDGDDAGQRALFAAATHFNPVFLACALRDAAGRSYDLERFVDPSAVFIARKSKDGRELKALERPGLWNGAMAHWLTVFVEVPEATFTPVKTITDLLRPAHQPE
ncbi:DUF4301 family protein [bacterium]|nr:DUF4301 family protein [bacterium]